MTMLVSGSKASNVTVVVSSLHGRASRTIALLGPRHGRRHVHDDGLLAGCREARRNAAEIQHVDRVADLDLLQIADIVRHVEREEATILGLQENLASRVVDVMNQCRADRGLLDDSPLRQGRTVLGKGERST